MRRDVLAVLAITALIAIAGCKEDPSAECGDNKKHSSEECDGTALGGMTCQDFGFLGGTLRCHADTCTYVFGGCLGGCGNNIAEGFSSGLDHEEPCDGTDLRGQNCTIEGFELGEITCLADCSGFDTSGCRNPSCGDGTVEGTEDCEPDVPYSEDCIDLDEGYNAGELGCVDCHWDRSACVTWECGNGVLEGLEQCDGTIFRDDEDCISLHHDGGELSCFPAGHETECRFDESTCDDYECGDGSVDGTEDCEPTVTFTDTCTDEGFLSGDLACHAVDDPDECQWDYASCVGGCGNDIIEGISDGLTADEVCDGTALGGATCESEGFSGGTLACQPTCDGYDTTGCIT